MTNPILEAVQAQILNGHPHSIWRNAKIVQLFQSGLTLEDVSVKFGITRERVRQIVAKFHLSAKDGGSKKRAISRIAKMERTKSEKRERRALKKFGCGYDEALSLNDGLAFKAQRCKAEGFSHQRRNAEKRGIEWSMTFPEWCKIWNESGKYPLRGRQAQSYVMSRLNDAGAYAIGNVKICTAVENISESYLVTTAEMRLKKRSSRLIQRNITAFELAEQGYSWAAIGQKLGVKVSSIGKYITYGERYKKMEPNGA